MIMLRWEDFIYHEELKFLVPCMIDCSAFDIEMHLIAGLHTMLMIPKIFNLNSALQQVKNQIVTRAQVIVKRKHF